MTTPAPAERVPRFLLKNERFAKLVGARAGANFRAAGLALKAGASGGGNGGGPEVEDGEEKPTLKLYQPAHQRYYMIAGCLVCRRPGLPDKALQTNREERVTFVIRRLMPSAPGSAPQANAAVKGFDEHAFVNKSWQKLTGTARQLAEGEDQPALSPLSFTDGAGRKRRMLVGLIPVAKREAYMGAPPAPAGGAGAASPGVLAKTERKMLFRSQVGEPWKRIIETAFTTSKSLDLSGLDDDDKPDDAQRSRQRKEAREQAQISSWYVLLDFAKFLKQFVPKVWDVIDGRQPASSLTEIAEQNLYEALGNVQVTAALKAALLLNQPFFLPQPAYASDDVPASMRDALKLALAQEKLLDEVSTPYDRENSAKAAAWPPFIFPLADPDPALFQSAPSLANGIPPLGEADFVKPDEVIAEANDAAKQELLDGVDDMTALVVRAMPKESSAPAPPPPLASQPLLDPSMREGLFVVRCVYERPLCEPFEPPEVSDPSEPFQMAGFFDPDAPARPIRIALPIDTSPAGLRKFDKNTAFMISDVLCGQIQRMKSLTFGDLVLSVLPWPFHKDLSAAAPDSGACKSGGNLEIGMICSLSLPIITICALLLLIIIVFLLDIVFKWIPYFFICFPIPGFKGKK